MNQPPFVRNSVTSEQAAIGIVSKASTLRERVYALLVERGPMTDEQMQDVLEMNPSTQRPRRIELVQDGRVVDSGEVGLTKSGRQAVLWRVQ
jgi:transcription initiation factor IIE alpha subunit